MQVTRRDLAILSVFGAVVVSGTIYWTTRQVNVSESSTDSVHTTRTEGFDDVKQTVLRAAQFAEPQYIPQRNQLRPRGEPSTAQLSKQESNRRLAARSRRSLRGPGRAVAGAPPVIPGGPTGAPRSVSSENGSSNRPGTGDGARSSSAGGSSEKKLPNIAVTGVLMVKGRRQIVVENLDTKEVRFAKPGDTVFGYRIIGVNRTGDRVLLDGGGNQVLRALGEGKQVEKKESPKKTDTKPGSATSTSSSRSSAGSQSPGGSPQAKPPSPSAHSPAQAQHADRPHQLRSDRPHPPSDAHR